MKHLSRLFALGSIFASITLASSLSYATAPLAQDTSSNEPATLSAATVDESTTQIKVSQDDPFDMVKAAASRTFARIKLEQSNIQNDPEILRTIMEEELMPYIDYRFSSFKVLGKYTRSASSKELQEFVTVFRQYLITSYAVAMGYYDDQVVEFEPAKEFGARSDVTVRAVIKDDARPEIKVAFKVRKGRDGTWQAYDMVAEGISLLSSKQSEFESILRKDGIDKVIELMRESIRKPIVLQNNNEEAA